MHFREHKTEKMASWSLEKMYDQYGALLYRVCLAELLNQQDAEDAVQEVFLKLLQKQPEFSDEEHQRAWLIRVAVNQSRDFLRRRRVRAVLPLEEESLQTELERCLGTAHQIQQEQKRVLTEVLELPEKYRMAVVLHYLEGYSVREIGRMLHLSESAVKMRLSRGRESLKKEWEEGHV